jgi:hypothetical protein
VGVARLSCAGRPARRAWTCLVAPTLAHCLERAGRSGSLQRVARCGERPGDMAAVRGPRSCERFGTNALVGTTAPTKAIAWIRCQEPATAGLHHCCIVAQAGVGGGLPLRSLGGAMQKWSGADRG